MSCRLCTRLTALLMKRIHVATRFAIDVGLGETRPGAGTSQHTTGQMRNNKANGTRTSASIAPENSMQAPRHLPARSRSTPKEDSIWPRVLVFPCQTQPVATYRGAFLFLAPNFVARAAVWRSLAISIGIHNESFQHHPHSPDLIERSDEAGLYTPYSHSQQSRGHY